MAEPVFLSGDAVPSYLTGVELMTAGMEWPAMNGPCTITLEHLADAVRASKDPHIQPPRIKLGHCSPVNGDHPNYDAFAEVGDAEPAFGVFRNLRLENDGAVLVGDADNVPAWLAEAALSAYPSRSAEGDWDVTSPGQFRAVGGGVDVQTAGGQRYSFVCTAVSLLGVYAPAISDLEDLQTLIMDGPAALTEKQPVAAAATSDGAALSVSYDTVWERSLRWLRENKPDWPYSWTRDVRVDPDECIIDDDEGHLWALPFSTDGTDEITFGPALAPRAPAQYPPALSASRLVASFARPSKPSPKPAAVAANTPAASARPEPEGVNMDDDVRAFLVAQGFDPETVTEDQINAASVFVAAAALNAPATPAATTEPEGDDDTADEPTAEATSDEPAPEREPVAASAPDPITAAKDAAFARLSAEVAELRAERERSSTEAATARRDEKISAALLSGRITPAEKDSYRKLLDIDETEAGALLAALPPDRVPLAARAQVPDPEADSLPAGQPLPDNVSLLNSSERAALAARRAV